MQKNTETTWGSRAKVLHWLIALMILAEVSAGFVMPSTYAASFKDEDMLGLHNLMAQIEISVRSSAALAAPALQMHLQNPLARKPGSAVSSGCCVDPLRPPRQSGHSISTPSDRVR
jgi:hypothetical protein